MVLCYHCNEQVPKSFEKTVKILGQQRAMCCAGCHAVADTIVKSGLESYYQQRSKVAMKTEAPVPDFLTAYDQPSLQKQYLETPSRKPNIKRINLLVENIQCAACAWLIEKQLCSLAGVTSAKINSLSYLAVVVFDSNAVALSEVMRTIHDLGFKPTLYTPNTLNRKLEHESKNMLKRLGVAGLGMMQVMMYAIGLYFGAFDNMADEYKYLLYFASLVVTIPVLFYSAMPILLSALQSFKGGKLSMDLPIALALILAFIASISTIVQQGQHVYFDSIVMFVFFLLLGRSIELFIRHKGVRALNKINDSMSIFANRVDSHGKLQVVPINELKPNDQIVIKVGEPLPCDGVLQSSKAQINEALVSGESRPKLYNRGAKLKAGSYNMLHSITILITNSVNNSYLSQLVNTSSVLNEGKTELTRFVDNLAGYFVMGVLTIALLSGFVWSLQSIQQGVWVAITVLAVSCPCALSLATPVALSFYQLSLSLSHIILRREGVCDSISRVTDVIFDKTGTLTNDAPKIAKFSNVSNLSDNKILAIVAALERVSNHPVANAFTEFDDPALAIDNAKASLGGVQGKMNNRHYYFGSAHYLEQQLGEKVTECDKPLYLYQDNKKLAHFVLQENLRLGAIDLCQTLKQQGLNLHLLSGDRVEAVNRVAEQVGINNVLSGCQPEDKSNYIVDLHKKNRCVLMIGDGINDMLGLAGADLSIAVGERSHLVANQSDIVLLASDLKPISNLFNHSDKTNKVVQQNCIWALCYNAFALTIAALGLITPYWAALGMSISSMVVVLNALRLSTIETTTADKKKQTKIKGKSIFLSRRQKAITG